jgi:argonaute-like protein implicated in RNA metabolism and viral defense
MAASHAENVEVIHRQINALEKDFIRGLVEIDLVEEANQRSDLAKFEHSSGNLKDVFTRGLKTLYYLRNRFSAFEEMSGGKTGSVAPVVERKNPPGL